jgi:hypothetical protein
MSHSFIISLCTLTDTAFIPLHILMIIYEMHDLLF